MSLNQKRTGVILSYVSIFLTIIISLLYSPIMIRILGQNEYGIYNVATSTISYLSLLSLGLNGSYLRFYSIVKKNSGEENVKRLNGLYLFVFSLIGLLALLIGLVLSANVGLFFNKTYSQENLKTARILFIFLSINIAISFPASVFTSYITSQEKFIFLKSVNIISMLASPCINIILLYNGYASVGMVITTTSITILVLIINIIYCLKKIKMKISFKKMDFSLFKKILFFSLFISMNQIIELVNWQTDKIILGKMIGGAVVAVYAVGSHINSLFTNFSIAVSSVFAPKINMIVEEKKPDMDQELLNIFIKVGRIQWFILILILSGFIFFGKFFIYMWVGEGYENSYYVAILLMSPALVPLVQNAGIEIQRAKNKHHVRSVVYLIIAIINVGISIVFAKYWKEIGCALGTTLSLLIGPIIFMNFYYHKKLGLDMIKFWKSILKTFPGLVAPFILGVSISLFYPFKGLLDFTIIVVLYSVAYSISVYFLSFNEYEKNIVTTFMHRLFKKRKMNI